MLNMEYYIGNAYHNRCQLKLNLFGLNVKVLFFGNSVALNHNLHNPLKPFCQVLVNFQAKILLDIKQTPFSFMTFTLSHMIYKLIGLMIVIYSLQKSLNFQT